MKLAIRLIGVIVLFLVLPASSNKQVDSGNTTKEDFSTSSLKYAVVLKHMRLTKDDPSDDELDLDIRIQMQLAIIANYSMSYDLAIASAKKAIETGKSQHEKYVGLIEHQRMRCHKLRKKIEQKLNQKHSRILNFL